MKIEYVGVHDVVDVPAHQLGEVARCTPIDVPEAVRDDLITHPDWRDAVEPEPIPEV